MSDWRDWFQARAGDDRMLAHPGAPAGGGGAGQFRSAGSLRGDPHSSVPHPASPAGRHFSWSLELPRFETGERAVAVFRSLNDASKYIPVKLLEATGMELHTVVAGIIPGLLMFLGVLCATTVLGGAVGAAIGFLAGGVGAVPCAAIGAELGLEAGIALLDFLGLAFLAAYIGKSLLDACKVSGHAVQRAWRAPETPSTQAHEIDAAAREQARAVALVFCGLLQGLVAFLLAKGTAAAASRVPELVANLRNSKLGAGFASWVEKNWKGLIDNPRLKDRSEPVNPVAEAAVPPGAPKKAQKLTKGTDKSPRASGASEKTPRGDLHEWRNYTKTADVSTEPNKAVFYSGKGARAQAETFAREKGLQTLEGTPGGKIMDEAALFDKFEFQDAMQQWETLSTRYAENASGTVQALVSSPRPESVFMTKELPALINNENVDRIIISGDITLPPSLSNSPKIILQ